MLFRSENLFVDASNTIDDDTNGFFKFDDDADTGMGVSYETMDFSFVVADDDVAYGEVKMYDGDKVFLAVGNKPNLDVVKANPDADLSFVNFKGAPTFSSSVDFQLYADEDSFVYELKDGKLVKTSLKWDEDEYAYVGKVRTLGTYVLSDIELVDAATERSEERRGGKHCV